MHNYIFILAITLFTGAAIANTSADSAIEQRQAAFKEIKAETKAVKGALKQPDFATATAAAQTILDNSQRLQGLFPDGSWEGDTRAKKKIWDNLADFQERQQKFTSDAEQLLAASQANDAGKLKDAFKALSKNCKGCHWKYRQVF